MQETQSSLIKNYCLPTMQWLPLSEKFVHKANGNNRRWLPSFLGQFRGRQGRGNGVVTGDIEGDRGRGRPRLNMTKSLSQLQCFIQRPVHPSYGRVKQNVDGCLFVWTGMDG